MPVGSIRLDDNCSVQSFKKELIRVGEFKINNGQRTLDVGADDLDSWAKQYHDMIKAGNKISIPATHEGHGDPNKNQGWVTDMFVEGDKLIGVLELHGENAIESASKSDVSIWAVPDWTDGNGNEYPFPIRHVAMTADPQIPGMKEFVAIAASNDDKPENVPVFKPTTGEPMKFDFTKLSTTLSKAFGIELALTAENVGGEIIKVFKAVGDKDENAKQVIILAGKITALETQIKAGPVEIKLTANERMLSAAMLNTKLNTLVKESKLDASAADALRKELSTDLLLSVNIETKTANYDRILDAIAKNNPVALGAVAGRQAVELATNQNTGEESRMKTESRMGDSLHPAKVNNN